MWEKAAADLGGDGGTLEFDARVTLIRHADGCITSVETTDSAGRVRSHAGDAFILSMPLRETVLAFDPPLPAAAVAAAEKLRYRDFLAVALVVEGALTGLLAARNLPGGRFNLCHVNTDAEYHEPEPARDTSGRQAPEPLA